MAVTPRWRKELIGKIYQNEISDTMYRVEEVDDPAFAIAEDIEGNTHLIPWVQIESGYYREVT